MKTTDEDLWKLAGENILKVFREVEIVRDLFRSSMLQWFVVLRKEFYRKFCCTLNVIRHFNLCFLWSDLYNQFNRNYNHVVLPTQWVVLASGHILVVCSYLQNLQTEDSAKSLYFWYLEYNILTLYWLIQLSSYNIIILQTSQIDQTLGWLWTCFLCFLINNNLN